MHIRTASHESWRFGNHYAHVRSAVRTLCLAFVIACAAEEPDIKLTALAPADITLSAPVFDVGGNDEIMYPSWATRLVTGDVAISDVYAASVLFFDSTGNLIRTSGRRGFGPGEFQAPGWLDTCADDSIFVYDMMQSRMTVLNVSGVAVRQFMMPPATLLACAPGEPVMALISPPAGPRKLSKPDEKRRRFMGALSLANTDGEVKTSIGDVPLEEVGPLGKISSIAMGGKWLWFGSADSGYAELYTQRGKPVRTVPLQLPLRPATRRDLDRHVEQAVSFFRDKRTREQNRAYWGAFPTPMYLPAYSRLVADPDGNVWAVKSPPGDSLTQLRGVSPEGHLIADITLPLAFKIFEVGSDYILGAYENDGRPHVAMYKFKVQ